MPDHFNSSVNIVPFKVDTCPMHSGWKRQANVDDDDLDDVDDDDDDLDDDNDDLDGDDDN